MRLTFLPALGPRSRDRRDRVFLQCVAVELGLERRFDVVKLERASGVQDLDCLRLRPVLPVRCPRHPQHPRCISRHGKVDGEIVVLAQAL